MQAVLHILDLMDHPHFSRAGLKSSFKDMQQALTKHFKNLEHQARSGD